MPSRSTPATDDVSVLYVEDDPRLARLTGQYLESHGMVVHLVSRGDEAVAATTRLHPDVVLLDLMLPGLDGLEVCRRLRARTDVPIVMVTARDEEADRVMGLEGGADDYISKPFSPRELLARIRAQARRARGQAGPRPERIDVGDLAIDTGSMRVWVAGRELSLTTYEFDLLRVLAERPGRVLTRDQLQVLVRGTTDEAFDRSVDVHISRLRQKLGENPKSPRRIKTVRGVGYVLTLTPEP